MNKPLACPVCGTVIPSDGPVGLCPRCLMRAGLESSGAVDPSRQPTLRSPGGNANQFVPPSPAELSEEFPQLEILELLGKGGMGAVYKARQIGLDRFVAVKVLPPEFGQDPAFAERFTREARALARLSHPHIVAVHDFGQTRTGRFYFLMEYVDGVNLRGAMQAGRIAPGEALAIVPQVCDALQFAHDEGIVHRDIKPENILIDKRGRVKIADFGLAKLLHHGPEETGLTGTQQVMGTLRYMAPEQIEATRDVDHRADIFSLGVVFYELLTGELPLGRFAAPSQKVEIDVRLDEIVLRALEKSPEQRYQQASAVKVDLEAVTSSVERSRPMPAGDLTRSTASAPSRWIVSVASLATLLLVLHIGSFAGLMLDSFRGSDGRLVDVGQRFGFGSTTESVQVCVLLLGLFLMGVTTAFWSHWFYRVSLVEATGIADVRERARVLLRGPVVGLVLMGLVALPVLFLAFTVFHGSRFFGDEKLRLLDWAALFGYLQFGWIAVWSIRGSVQVLEFESHPEAVDVGRTSLYWPTLNLFAFLPISLWMLAVLGRDEVRQAFRVQERDAKLPSEPSPSRNSDRPAPVPEPSPAAALPMSGTASTAMLVAVGAGLSIGLLCATAGLVLVPAAFYFAPVGSGPFWGWMGGAFGCLCGGLGSAAGSWNSLRQLQGRTDWMQAPHWTGLDRVILGYGILGGLCLLIPPALSLMGLLTSLPPEIARSTWHGAWLLGGLIVFQAGLFLLLRAPFVFARNAGSNRT